MQLQEMITLIQAVSDSELTEFSYEENGVKLCLKKRKGNQAADVASVNTGNSEQDSLSKADSSSLAAAGAEQPEIAEEGKQIISPMVGTFYTAPSEDTEAYVSVGDTVKKGQVVGIVEAMKLMNEIESPVDGVVEEILAENKELVGYGQVLFRIR